MNIQCPKCQFSQPKDQYCAQCGVDISKHQKKPSFKTKKLLIHFVIPVAVLAGSLILFNQSTKQSCPPVCLPTLQHSQSDKTSSATKPNTKIVSQKSNLNLNKKHLSKNIKITSAVKVRTPSAVDKKKLNAPVAQSKAAPLKLNNPDSALQIEAKLISLPKSFVKFSWEGPELKAIAVVNRRLKNILTEHTEILNEFSKNNIQKALTSLKLPLKTKGLRLIILSNLPKNLSANTKLFFEHLNLDADSLQAAKESDTLIAILINVH